MVERGLSAPSVAGALLLGGKQSECLVDQPGLVRLRKRAARCASNFPCSPRYFLIPYQLHPNRQLGGERDLADVAAEAPQWDRFLMGGDEASGLGGWARTLRSESLGRAQALTTSARLRWRTVTKRMSSRSRRASWA